MSDTAALWGGPVCSALLGQHSHRGLCPQNTRQPRQDINTNSSKGVPWSWWPCAGRRNLISYFVTRTGTNGGCGGSWACVTGCWQQPDLRAVELLFKLSIAQNSHCWVMCENVSATPAWGKEQSDSAGCRDHLRWRRGAWPDLSLASLGTAALVLCSPSNHSS